ncbi:MAG TPA: hypothetical protein VFX16_36490 [Pseudonocardiaceae bacterium]|nr:hypothetical protein [Pseudonocardiaceae bacterium]
MLQEQPRDGQPPLFRDGDLPGFHANLAMLRAKGLGIYVVRNGDGTNGVANWDGKDLIDQIVDRYVPNTNRPSSAVNGRCSRSPGSRYWRWCDGAVASSRIRAGRGRRVSWRGSPAWHGGADDAAGPERNRGGDNGTGLRHGRLPGGLGSAVTGITEAHRVQPAST